jgi:hypothetical protein
VKQLQRTHPWNRSNHIDTLLNNLERDNVEPSIRAIAASKSWRKAADLRKNAHQTA